VRSIEILQDLLDASKRIKLSPMNPLEGPRTVVVHWRHLGAPRQPAASSNVTEMSRTSPLTFLGALGVVDAMPDDKPRAVVDEDQRERRRWMDVPMHEIQVPEVIGWTAKSRSSCGSAMAGQAPAR